MKLRDYARRIGQGWTFPDGVGFRVRFPHRESFRPKAAAALPEVLAHHYTEVGLPERPSAIGSRAVSKRCHVSPIAKTLREQLASALLAEEA